MPKKKIAILICYLLSACFLDAQTITLKGSVKDSLQNPLAYANVIAKPLGISKNLQFAISVDDGYYKLALTKNNCQAA